MTVNELITELGYRLGNRTDTTSRLPIWLNDAYFELLLSPRFSYYELDKSYAFPTIAQQRTYNIVGLVPDLWFILDLRNETLQQKMSRYHWSEFDRKWRVFAIPVRYTRYGPNIELEPVPDKAYDLTMRYRLRPGQLIPGGTHILGREWDEVILTMAVQKGWEALEQWDKSKAQKELVELQLAAREEPLTLEDADSETTIWPASDTWR